VSSYVDIVECVPVIPVYHVARGTPPVPCV
jgi:hypothetical protein